MKVFAIFLAAAMMFFATETFSQQPNPMRIGGELGLQLPMGDFGDAAGTGFALAGIFQYELNPNLIIGGTIGYQSFGGKSDGYSWSNIPIMGLVNYKFNPDGLIPFVGAEFGLNMLSVTVEAPFFGSYSSSSTELGINFLGGVEQRLNQNLSWRVNAKYNIIFNSGGNLSFLGINAGVMYHL